MTSNGSLYDVLGVARDASLEQIRTAYRTKARALHPDNQETGDQEAFQELGRAHDVLSDAEARAYYDATGRMDSPGERKLNENAVQYIAAFVESLGDVDDEAFQKPILELFKLACEREKGRLRAHVSTLEKQIKNLERFRSKVSRDPSAYGDDVIASITEKKIEMLRQDILGGDGEMKMIDRAIELISHYRFTPDARPQPVFTGAFTVTAGTSTSTSTW